VVGVHLVGGMVGALLTGVFVSLLVVMETTRRAVQAVKAPDPLD